MRICVCEVKSCSTFDFQNDAILIKYTEISSNRSYVGFPLYCKLYKLIFPPYKLCFNWVIHLHAVTFQVTFSHILFMLNRNKKYGTFINVFQMHWFLVAHQTDWLVYQGDLWSNFNKLTCVPIRFLLFQFCSNLKQKIHPQLKDSFLFVTCFSFASTAKLILTENDLANPIDIFYVVSKPCFQEDDFLHVKHFYLLN